MNTREIKRAEGIGLYNIYIYIIYYIQRVKVVKSKKGQGNVRDMHAHNEDTV